MSAAVLKVIPRDPSTGPATPHDMRIGNNRGLTQAYELRDLAANLAIALKEELTDDTSKKLIIRRDEDGKPVDAPAVAQLIRAWSEAREAIRILRGRPLPGSLRPQAKPSKPRASKFASAQPRPVRQTPASDTQASQEIRESSSSATSPAPDQAKPL